MIFYGLLLGGGLLVLLLPVATAPPLGGAALMASAGIAREAYSPLGRISVNPIETTAGIFLRACVLGLIFKRGLARFFRVGCPRRIACCPIGHRRFWLRLRYLVHGPACSSRDSCCEGSTERTGHCGTRRGLLLDEPLSLHLVLCARAILAGIALVLHARTAEPARRS